MAGRTTTVTLPRAASLWTFALVALLPCGSGCHRRYYRQKADKEVVEVLTQKDQYPDWKIENWHVYPDPRARFADPTNPDRPPMPPDDPAAFDLSPNPQKPHHVGVARVGGTAWVAMLEGWNFENRAERARREAEKKAKEGEAKKGTAEEQDEPKEKDAAKGKDKDAAKAKDKDAKSSDKDAKEDPAAKKETTPKAEEREPYILTLEQATELGLFNSRDYQDRREDLYLAALPVTTERFAFSAQYFAAGQAFREWAGRQLPLEQRNRWRINGQAGFTKVFPTGALLLLRFANQTVINLTGTSKNGTVSVSNLDFDIVQPLLAGAGRKVTLEPLTQVERNLLYEVRDYARFRKEFYVGVATGQAFTRGTGGVPGTGNVTVRVSSGIGITARPQVDLSSGGGAGPIEIVGVAPQGYLPVILLRAQLDNERENIEVLQTAEEQFRSLFAAQLIDQAQFNQVRQQRLGSQSTIYQRQADYGNALDRFKLQLGLPTELPLELDDEPLRPLLRQVQAYEEVYGFRDRSRERPAERALREVRALLVRQGLAVAPGGTLTPDRLDVAGLRVRLRETLRAAEFLRGTPFPEEFLRRWTAWGPQRYPTAVAVQDRRLELSDRRRNLRREIGTLEQQRQTAPEELLRRVQETDFEIELADFEIKVRLYESQPWTRPGAPGTAQGRADQESQFREVIAAFAAFLREAREEVLDRPRRERLKQIQDNWPELARTCVDGVDLISADEEDAVQAAGRYALTNRFDLMNVRAQLVDSWRKIAVAANSLLGTFNVEYHLESTTPAGLARPLAFSGGRTRQQLILNGELPIVRLLERNQYRATLIGYQRQRRALMEAEDQVLATVRAEVRQLRNVARNYNEIQKGYRQNLDLAYFQVDLASEFINAPPQPTGGALPQGTVGPPTAGRGAGGDPAALTQQYLGALRSLVGAKNDLYRVWLDYQTNRLALYRDLELMPLDFRGVWIDDTANCLCGTPPDRPATDGGAARPDDAGAQGRAP